MIEYMRTRILGWVRKTPTPADVIERAERARAFLDNQVLAEAYQDMLDRYVDEMLTVQPGPDQVATVMRLHGQAQALISLLAKLRAYMSEVDIMEAKNKQREMAAAQRKNAA